MRLTAHEREQIVDAARRHFGATCRVILFGSRTNDAARGGDIDLMIETAAAIADPVRLKSKFLMDVWKRIGERRIDVVLKTPTTTLEPIHEIAHALGVEI